MANKLRQQVDGIRAEIEAAKTERDSTAALPATPEEVAANVEGWISAKAAEWKPAIGEFVQPGGAPRDFTLALPLVNVNAALSSTDSQREAALCALFPDRIREVLLERCERHMLEHGSGLPLAERLERIAQLDGRIRTLEEREEALLLEAEAEGIEIDRRPDASPWIVFGIEVVDTAEATPRTAPTQPRRTRSSGPAPTPATPWRPHSVLTLKLEVLEEAARGGVVLPGPRRLTVNR